MRRSGWRKRTGTPPSQRRAEKWAPRRLGPTGAWWEDPVPSILHKKKPRKCRTILDVIPQSSRASPELQSSSPEHVRPILLRVLDGILQRFERRERAADRRSRHAP